MGLFGWTLLISIIILALVYFLFKNSFDCRKRSYDKETGTYNYEYDEKDRLTAPLWFYVVVAILLFVPVLNVLGAGALLVMLLDGYCEGKIYLHVPSLQWLTKEY